MKILVTGACGQLGHDCIKELMVRGFLVVGIDKKDVDISNRDSIKSYIVKVNPDVVIHCAAWTNVDEAENEIELVYKINSFGTKYIAEACKLINAKMLYVSTDYVFSGNKKGLYEVFDFKDGISIYGRSKALGEDYVIDILDKYFIVRISWVFGLNGNNFVKKMLSLKDKKRIEVVCDQIGSVTYTADLSKLFCDIINTEKYGIYHASNEGYLSWYDFAVKIFELLDVDIKIDPIMTKEYMSKYPYKAKRPLNSCLNKVSLVNNGFKLLPNWEDALKRYLAEVKNE